MDNKFIDINLVERYVLKQLTEEELTTFRGHLMFDEELRKQVVETKMLMNALATIRGAGNVKQTPKLPIAIAKNSKQMLRVAALVGTLLVSGFVYYNWLTPKKINLENKETQINIPIEEKALEKKAESVPAQNEVTTEPAIDTKIVNPKEVKVKTEPSPKIEQQQRQEDKEDIQIFADNSNRKHKASKNDPEEVIFSAPKFFQKEDDGIIAFAQVEEKVNPFIEDAIENSGTKGRTGLVKIKDFENGMTFFINKNNAVDVKLKGSIETKAGSNKIYSFKLFNNNTESFIANMPLYQESLKANLYGVNSLDFAINFKIELAPGLYYFTIEEGIDNEHDMIYAGKIYIYAGKFHVEKN